MVANPAFAASAIPSTHTAAVSEKVGDYPVLKQLTTPRPSSLLAGQALVKICFAGVCHSDVALALGKGTHRPLEPIISGHEGTGYIVALGPHTRPGPGPKIGDKVGIKFIADTCGNCNACETGHEECCLTPSISGITRDGVCKAFRFESLGDADNCGDPSPASALYVFYTLLTASSQFVVASTLHLTPLPEGISLMSAAPILCAGVTVYKALMAAGLDPGDYVVIPGAGGGLGHLAVQYALAMNYRVIAIDSGEDKRALMLRYGVYLWIDFRDEPDLVAAIRHAAGGHPIKAAIVTAGSIAPYQQALQYLGPRSTLVCVGLPHDSQFLVDAVKLVLSSSKIIGSSLGSRAEVKLALSFVSMGKVIVEHEVRPFSDIASVYRDLEAGKVKGRIVLDLALV